MPVENISNTEFIKATDTVTTILLLLLNEDGTNYDLTDKTITARFLGAGKLLLEKQVTTDDNGYVVIQFDEGDYGYLGIGTIQAEIVVTDGEDTKIFPNDGYLEFGVVYNTKSLLQNNVNVISLQTFEQSFSDMEILADRATDRANAAAKVVEDLAPTIADLDSIADRAETAATNAETAATQAEETNAAIVSDINVLELKTYNVISAENYGVSNSNTDNYVQLQTAIDAVYQMGGGILLLPKGTTPFGSTLNWRDKVRIYGLHGDVNATSLKYNGTGFALVTSDTHLRQEMAYLNLILNPNADGIRIGDTIANLDRDAGILPRQIHLEQVIIQQLNVGRYGIKMMNASHVTMEKVRPSYGSGGIALSIQNDGYNSGVFEAKECSFGRHGSSEIGVQMISGTGFLDGYTFNSCYFGGKTPFKTEGTSALSAVVLNSPHFEPTTGTEEVYCMDLSRVKGLVVNSPQFAGFGASNVVAVLFREACSGIEINSPNVNEFNGIVYKSIGTSPRNIKLTEATTTGTSTVQAQFSGDFQYATKITGGRLKHDYLEYKQLFGATGNREDWAATSQTNDSTPASWTRGDKRKNSTPSITKNIYGWQNVTSGTPGTTAAIGMGYGTTTDRNNLSLTAGDQCYIFFDTTLNKFFMWNGAAWMG